MERRRNTPARVIAVLALVLGVLATIVIVAGSTGGGDGDHSQNGGRAHHAKPKKKDRGKQGKTPATYVVESGDTLTSIAAKTGLPVATIQKLNPSIDPQILVTGQTLKLR